MGKKMIARIFSEVLLIILLSSFSLFPAGHLLPKPDFNSTFQSKSPAQQQPDWEDILRRTYQLLGWTDFSIKAATENMVITSHYLGSSGTFVNFAISTSKMTSIPDGVQYNKSTIDYHSFTASQYTLFDNNQNAIGHSLEWPMNGLYFVVGMATDKTGGYSGSMDQVMTYAEALYAAASGSGSPKTDACAGVTCNPDHCAADSRTLNYDCACDPQDGQCYCYTKTCEAGCDAQLGACKSAAAADLCAGVVCAPSCEENSSFSNGTCDPESGVCLYATVDDCELAGCDAATGLCRSQTDLAIKDVKVLQAVEGGKLVAKKPTLVAVSLNWPDESRETEVNVSLFIDGKGFSAQRFNVKATYNQGELLGGKNLVKFYIPMGFLQGGQHQFQVEAVISDADILDPDISNNAKLVSHRFWNSINFTLLFAAHPAITEDAIWRFYHKARPLLLEVYPIENIFIVPTFYTLDPNESEINQVALLESLREIYNSVSGQYATYAVGLFPDYFFGADIFGTSHFWARRSVMVGDGSRNSNAQNALPHEMGHVLFGEEYTKEKAGNYLPAGTWIYHSHNEDLEIVASDLIYVNIMGEAGGLEKIWVNQQTWDQLLAKFSWEQVGITGMKAFAMPLPVQDTIGPGFLVAGTISITDQVQITSLIALDSIHVENPVEGDFWLEAYGDGNILISKAPIELDFSSDSTSHFLSTISADAKLTRRLKIVHGTSTIWQASPSKNPPTVSIQTPPASAPLTGSITIQWQAQDADSDILSYTLLYSVDDGSTWLPIEVGLTEASYNLDIDRLPGAEKCRLRVLASDGWYTSIADTPTAFAVADKEPVIVIENPTNGQEYETGIPIEMSVYAYDKESGWIDGDLIAWESSLDGSLGTGNFITLDNLSPGTHAITASAMDNKGRPVQAQVDIVVGSDSQNTSSDVSGFYIAMAIFSILVAAGAVAMLIIMKRKGKQSLVIVAAILLAISILCLLGAFILLVFGSDTSSNISARVPLEKEPAPAVADSPSLIVAVEPVAQELESNAPAPAVPEVPEIPEPQTNLSDNFSDDFSQPQGWSQISTERFSAGLAEGGIYRIDFWQASDNGLVVIPQPQELAEPSADMTLKVGAAGMNENGAYGLVCRLNGEDLYGFHVANDGRFWVYKSVNGVAATLDRGTNSAITADSNQLEMRCIDNNITSFVNGVQVSQVNDNDLVSGGFGLFAQPFGGDILGAWSFYATFDNFSAEYESGDGVG